MVTGFTMFLAYKRPRRARWWALLIGLSLPAAGAIAYLLKEHPSRGLIAGSFAGMAFSIVAAVGGTVLRRVVNELFPPKASSSPAPSTFAAPISNSAAPANAIAQPTSNAAGSPPQSRTTTNTGH